MARITASVYTSHVPAIGAALDHHRNGEPYWQPVFEGYRFAREWIAARLPDVVVLVYNDHATAFGPELVPTFALGTAAEFPIADEGFGPRPVPPVQGHPELAAHIAQSLIEDDFDLTLANRLPVDHGLTVPLSLMFGAQPASGQWPVRVIPLAVNVVQYPVPSGARCLALGRALHRAVHGFPAALDVQVWGTGGMSHQLQGRRAGLINRAWDQQFLDRLIAEPEALAAVPTVDYVREAGSEGVELVMWLVARGAMSDLAGGPPPRALRRFYHVPASNTAVGHLILENPEIRP
jgi:protocatechuate 4,5-dioxygenase beta chain